MRATNIGIVCLCYGRADTERTVPFALALARRIAAPHIVWVANSDVAQEVLLARTQGPVLRGSNLDHEWSGYQEGLDMLRALAPELGGVVFLNDTVVTHRWFSMFRLWSFCIATRRATVKDRPQLVGFMDSCSNAALEIFGIPLERWASTYIFYLNSPLLRHLDYELRRGIDSIRSWEQQSCIARFFPDWINQDLQDHLRNWLFSGGWYAARELDQQSLPKLKSKAKAIFFEMALSAECAAFATLSEAMPRNTVLWFVDRLAWKALPKRPPIGLPGKRIAY